MEKSKLEKVVLGGDQRRLDRVSGGKSLIFYKLDGKKIQVAGTNTDKMEWKSKKNNNNNKKTICRALTRSSRSCNFLSFLHLSTYIFTKMSIYSRPLNLARPQAAHVQVAQVMHF